MAKLMKTLVAGGIVAAAVAPAVEQGFERCFVDRVRSNDVTVTPASCRRAEAQARSAPVSPAARRRLTAAIGVRAANDALATDFRRAFEWALVYEMAVFALAAALTFLLPRVAAVAGHAPAEPGAQPDEMEAAASHA